MKVDRPAPGEELNRGTATTPREAATVIVLRGGAQTLEVLLVKRNPEQRFMGGAWVFPGGAVHAEDADHAATGVRELGEEADIELPEDAELVPFSRWITPAQVKVRFDTHFFVARAPDGARATPDGGECVDARWIRPADALAAGERGELMLVFPTIKHLEQLTEHPSVGDALEAARNRTVEPIQPRVVARDGGAELLLPGDPGFDEA